MGCIYDNTEIALHELNGQLQEESKRFGYDGGPLQEMLWGPYILRDVRSCVENFDCEFKCLTMFLDCIHKWSDADKVVPNLGSLAIKIEASIERFGNQLAESIHHRRATQFQTPSSSPQLKALQEWESKLVDIFDSLNRDIWSLKQRISEACDSSVSHSFRCRSPMHDFDRWKKFVQTVESKLGFLAGKAYPNESVMELVYAFKERLRLVICFLHALADSSPNNGYIENAMIHVGSVVIAAAFLICQFWNKISILEKENDVILTFLDLQQKIDFATPEFAEMHLRLLETFQGNTNNKALKPVDIFVKHLFTFLEQYIEYRSDITLSVTLPSNLTSLITCVFNIPELHAEDVQRFFAEIKVLVMEVAYLEHLLREKNEIRSVGLNLLAETWLIKLEIFLRKQLTAQAIFSMEDQINVLNQGIQHLDLEEWQNVLKKHINDSPEGCVENWEQILTFMEELCSLVDSLNDSFQTNKMTIKMVRNRLFKLLLSILLFKVWVSLCKLRDTNGSLMVFFNDQIETLLQGLDLLSMFVSDDSIEDGKMVFEHVDRVACATISLCYSFPAFKITEEMINHTNYLLATLLDEIKLIMLQLKEIYLHVPCSNFPKTNGLGFIDSLLRKLRELLNSKADLIASVKHQIEQISRDIEFFRSFLRDILNQEMKVVELKDLITRAVNVAYVAEYLIDSIAGGNHAEWFNLLWLYHFEEDIRLTKKLITEVYAKKTYDVRVHNVVQTSRNMIPRAVAPRIDEAMVVLNDEEEVIINRLIGGFLQRDIVSIVGMAGIGKTTLAKKVYNCPQVFYHFHIRAWCCISEVYQKRELLLDILSHITALTDNVLAMTEEDLDLKLYQLLKQKRYLIVMDDLWNIEAWDDLGRSFPNDGNGSRILITSRMHDVALKANAHTDTHTLRLLSDAESWDLLQMKIFHKECCPEELMESGKQIAKSCKGLPLAIVAIAGLLLQKTDRQQDWWKEIAENISSWIIDDPQQQCMGILELSYKHLPDYLKACFIYFGAFQEDDDIPVRKLIRLWIAEDFIQETESKGLEDLAEDCLKDLISRSLVIFSQRRSRGGVKTCRVHDILRNLCQSKAQEDNFLRKITRFDLPDDSFDYVDLKSNPANSMTYEDHRLCICSTRKQFVMSRPSGTFVRSLLFFATSDTYPRCPYDISFISQNFILIKVLDLECINMGSSFPDGATLLVHLRYFAVSGDFDCVPSSIANLWNLEIFILKGLKGKVDLPETFWCMARLRHVHVSDRAVFSWLDDDLGSSSQLGNLVALSSPVLPYGEKSGKILRQFPSLRKLRCIFLESWDGSQNCNQFPSLDMLSQLESLKVSYYGRALPPSQFNFPVNLKKLTLSNFRLQWNHISVIGRLQNLEVLKLLSRAFEGERWDMVDGEFSKLKFLKLDTLNIVKWNASCDHLPNLQQLVLRCCKQLDEVPSSFVEIPTLEMIEIQWCGDAVEESVRKIREEANEGLKIFINLSESDHR